MSARARLLATDEIAPDVRQLELAMVDPAALAFRAGQFVSLLVPGPEGAFVKRPFSIASSPSRTDGFELLAKLVPGGLASDWLRTLVPGDEVSFVGPAGQFTAIDRHPGAAVFGVTGAGIAAALPVLTEILERPATHEHGPVRLFWGLRHERDIYWIDRLEALRTRSARFSYTLCLSRPEGAWVGVRGRIGDGVLAAAALPRPTFYLVGNGDMVRELRVALLERGVDRRTGLRTEIFYPVALTVARAARR